MEETGPGPDQFDPPVHAARVSNDDLVYVSDRGGKRVQVFTLEGKFVAQAFIDRWCEAPHCGNGQTVASTAFSHDPRAALPLRREPQPGAHLGARPQDAASRSTRSAGPASRPASSTSCTT